MGFDLAGDLWPPPAIVRRHSLFVVIIFIITGVVAARVLSWQQHILSTVEQLGVICIRCDVTIDSLTNRPTNKQLRHQPSPIKRRMQMNRNISPPQKNPNKFIWSIGQHPTS